MKKAIRNHIIVIVVIVLAIALLTSCKTKVQYVPVETVKTEYINKVQKDSIFHRDSIYIIQRGDTVFKYKYELRYRDKLNVDTIYRDSIVQIPYEVQLPPVVKKVYPKWLVILAIIGGGGLCFGAYRTIRLF